MSFLLLIALGGPSWLSCMFCWERFWPGRYLVIGVAADDLIAWLFGESNSWVE